MTRSFKLPHRSMLLALACTLVGTTALAQDPFPSKSIRIIAAGAPGGGMDLLARVIGDAPAHTVSQVARKAAQTLRQFVGARAARGAAAADKGDSLSGEIGGRNQP